MDRLTNYLLIFGLSLLLFFLFRNTAFIDSLMSLIFIVATIGFIFTREEKPDEETQEIPAAHFYQQSRTNYYGYTMVIAGVSAALLFFVLTNLVGIRAGFVSIILWVGIALTSVAAERINSKLLLNHAVTDYIAKNIKVKLDPKIIKVTVEQMTSAKDQTVDGLTQAINSKIRGLSPEISNSLIELYQRYMNEAFTEEIVSDEIEELNEKEAI